MRTRSLAMASALALAALASCGPPEDQGARSAQNGQTAAGGRYIVVLKDGASVAIGMPGSMLDSRIGLKATFRYALHGYAAVIPDDLLAAVRADPKVAWVVEDRKVSITAFPPDSGGIAMYGPPLQPIPTGVDRIDAEGYATTGRDVHVAVIDTGIDWRHPDLAGAVVGGINCAEDGWSYEDLNGHGTHVSGIIAARNDGIGVVGVAPEAKLWGVRVLDQFGSGTWSSVICGLDFVASRAPANGGPITVANMSLAGGGSSDNNCGMTDGDALHQAICRTRDAGVTIVVAAANASDDSAHWTPAAYDDAVITVSALADSDGKPGGLGAATSYGPDDTFATFSNYGPAVDIGAPGVDIWSTYKGGIYMKLSGTSMASPHVTGAVARRKERHPCSVWTDDRDVLRAAGEALGSGHTDPSGLHPEPILQLDGF